MKPSDQQRRLVKSLAAVGIRQSEIALMVDLRSTVTLRRHFRKELDRGAIEAISAVAHTLYKMATSGKCVAATIFYLKARGRWHERPTPDAQTDPPVPFIIAVQQPIQAPQSKIDIGSEKPSDIARSED
jgi:hypothetical protein